MSFNFIVLNSFYSICAALGRMEVASVPRGRHSIFYGVAGGVSISRVAAKHADALDEERSRGMVDGFGAVWIFAHHEYGLSELALRDSGVDRGNFLRVDMAQERIHLRLSNCARAGGRDMAFLVPDFLKKA